VSDGLPASYIFKVYQDSYGFIWASTFNGLSRFDGKEFINYGYENGMPNLIADAIYEDHLNRLWIGTRNGMAEIKGKRCLVYPVDDGRIINFVFSFAELNNGELWALTSSGAYTFQNDHWHKIRLYPGFENHSCRRVIQTDSGILINYGHHLVLKKNNKSFKLVSQISDDEVPGPYFNSLFRVNDTMYLNRADGLFKISGSDTISLFEHELKNKYILWTVKDSKNRFWVYTLNDRQLLVSEPGNDKHFFYSSTVPLISDFFEDKEGNMWIASLDGLVKVKSVDYESFDASTGTKVNGQNHLINAADSSLLATSATGEIFIYKGNSFKNFLLGNAADLQHAIPSEIIDAWCFDDRNRLWLIFRNQLAPYVLEKNKLRSFPSLVTGNIHPLTGIAYHFKGRCFYVGADTLQTGDERIMQNFKSNNTGEYIIRPMALHYFSNGLLMVETYNSGFFIIDSNKNSYRLPAKYISSHRMPGGDHIFDDPSGKFWIVSSQGMERYVWNSDKMPVKDLAITTSEGLPNNAVRSVVFDDYNRIWAVTLSGIVVIEIDDHNNIVVNRISEEQGIGSNLWNEVNLTKDFNGNIWAGLSNRLIKFKPSNIQFEKSLPAITIDRVQLNFKETNWKNWSDTMLGILQIPVNPVLPYNQNNLGISYKGISFSSPTGLEYSYKLDGADTGWSTPTQAEFVSFVGLPPGKYVFYVKARKSNSNWTSPAVFGFTINKPFWSEWWFRSLVFLFLASIIIVFYKYRMNQLKKLMALRMKISRDLHDEVGSTLSGIGLMSEIAKKQLENKSENEVKSSLEKISFNSEETLGKMSDIVWAINPQNDTYEKMIDRLKNFAKNTATPLGIQLNFDLDKNLSQFNLDMQRRNNIYLICKEAMNNAIRYSGCRNINFSIRTQDHQMKIAIADDGKGFDAQKIYTGNGLKNMRARADEIKIDLKVYSENEKGTIISLLIKSPD
jgi:ligand-binding sensor domain-containing protein